MIEINKNILRFILVLSYIIITAFLIFGISNLYSYLNTGADRSTMLHTEIKKIDQYLPKIEWETLNNEGRFMDAQTLNSIENDYLDAWYVKQIAYKTNTTIGIEDYYTKSAKKNIYSTIDLNTTEKISIESTTLQHHPTLEFFSEDGQLAVITDKDVIEYKRVFQNRTCVLETTEKATYKLTLLLEDGFWRIRHITKIQVEDYKTKFVPATGLSTQINGINYYPQNTPWDMFGDAFDPKIISKDFKIIKDAGLNSVRIFVQYDDFGKANVNTEKLKKLKDVLDLAEENNLKVMVTLFDFYGDYSVLDWSLNQRHAETIVSELKDHPALFAWDIKNEPNLDFDNRGESLVKAWLDKMIDLVKSIDTNHPVTIGWSNVESATILKDKLDIITFHYYKDLDDLDDVYKNLKLEIPNRQIAITEFGISSYKGLWNPFGNSEKDQTEYHQQAQTIFFKNNIQFMSWTLYDFIEIPKEVVGRLPWRKNTQKYFGFINTNGNKKAAFKHLIKP
ncbi:cellulase family glycosylhydrolase [Changchengzhania lutea]|uniref:cellulase family glycosylhydrolase n=1 Tax=Changchengzhania lutea TaxID=2049305 RepID=UPI00115E3C97|nr:cellulase family glycosylhydrolase [Changchengzhania lutea]